jgi:hypothetical protein
MSLVMCVRNPPTFAPNPLRGAWGLVENRAALFRRHRPQNGRAAPGTGCPVSLWDAKPPGDDPLQGEAATGARPAAPRARRLGAARGLRLYGRISDTVH